MCSVFRKADQFKERLNQVSQEAAMCIPTITPQITRTKSQQYQNAPAKSVRRCADELSAVGHTSALEYGTGLKIKRILSADTCVYCDALISSARQINFPGVDTRGDCGGPELPGAA